MLFLPVGVSEGYNPDRGAVAVRSGSKAASAVGPGKSCFLRNKDSVEE